MILSRTHVLLKDERSDLRIKEKGQIPWQIKYKKREGNARIHNMSISGMLIETDTSFDPKDECIFSFESNPDSGIYIPQVGRLVWHKKKKFSRKKYLCGIKFLEADEKVLTQMRSKVEEGVQKFIKKRRMTTTIGVSLCTFIIVSIVAISWLSSTIYRDVMTANEQMLSTSNQQVVLSQTNLNSSRANSIIVAQTTERLNIANQIIEENKQAINLFSEELEATKALLTQTENMLIQANDRNTAIEQELAAVKAAGGTGQAAVILPEEEIMSIADARSLMTAYREKIGSIKGEIKRLKAESREARAESIAQMDAQKSMLGNNGYLVRDGQSIEVDESQYQSLSVDQFQSAQASPVRQNVEIDVTFIE